MSPHFMGHSCFAFIFFWTSTYSWPGPLTLWPAPPPLPHTTQSTHDETRFQTFLIG